ncbi:MAG: AIR synthase related protein [Anaerolineales bacterium]|jgi:selenophosphate synthetase-related protein
MHAAQHLLDQFYAAVKTKGDLQPFIRRVRDLVLLRVSEDYVFVIACDSNASIGQKEHDYHKRDYKEVGRCASKVPLMEVIAAGAYPIVVIDNLCVEMEPSGRGILEGIRFEVERLGLDADLVITGSTEKNMVTTQTGLGVTVIGLARHDELKIGVSQPGDLVVCVGFPKSAPTKPFFEGEPDIMDPPSTRKLRKCDFVHEVIPVGSGGVRYEMGVLAEESGCSFVEVESIVDMTHSAGPSTCVLATIPEQFLSVLRERMTHPVNPVGYLVAK